MAQIVGLGHPNWPESIRKQVARYGRFVPRISLEIANVLDQEILVSEHQDRNLDGHLAEVRRTRRIDENGLGDSDIEYLELLEKQGNPIGQQHVLAMLNNIDKDRFLEEVEPLLVHRLNLVRRTDRGREITDEGKKYLVQRRQRQNQG